MPLLPVASPAPVPIYSGFDYVTVDAQRRRIYAAHSASQALTIVDADSGKVVGQVRVGPLHGVAVDPATGHVFTGNGDARSVSEVDPVTMKVVHEVDVDGEVDAIAYDPTNGHIYADEDDGTHVYVVDAKTFKQIAVIDVPGHKPEYLAVDPATHEVYQNISDLGEVVVIDGSTLKVTKTIPTPELKNNHPLQYDPGLHEVLVGGTNGMLSAYDPSGKLLGSVPMQARVDQCSLDATSHLIACAGNQMVSVFRAVAGGAPVAVATGPVARGVHTTAIDPTTGNVFVVWAEAGGDFVQAFSAKP
jgi:DNA-binding beta-propeller fold protein YncE